MKYLLSIYFLIMCFVCCIYFVLPCTTYLSRLATMKTNNSKFPTQIRSGCKNSKHQTFNPLSFPPAAMSFSSPHSQNQTYHEVIFLVQSFFIHRREIINTTVCRLLMHGNEYIIFHVDKSHFV